MQAARSRLKHQDVRPNLRGVMGESSSRRTWVLAVSALVIIAAAVYALDAHTWLAAQLKAAPVRSRLVAAFGSDVGRAKVSDVSIDGDPALGLAFELDGDLTDAVLCQAMLALDRARPGDPSTLDLTVISPDPAAHPEYRILRWDRQSGRLVHSVGYNPCECMVVTYLLRLRYACASESVPLGEVQDVGRAELQQFADGQPIPWQDL